MNPCNIILFFVELMNKDITMLTINNIHSQQNLNNRKEKLREEQHPIVDFSFGEWFVEKMLSIVLLSDSSQRVLKTLKKD